MPKSSTSFETFASPDELRAIVVDVEKYPEFLPEVKRVTVREKSADGFLANFLVEVKVGGSTVKSDYTVRYALKGNLIAWKLESSPDLSKNEGHWKLEETADGETKAYYEADLETTMPIPLELQKVFADQELPRMMQRFRDRAEA
jgi:ribosome-associated toxin RatA of RatAB toxin-antitoxin module